jgi:hypothetical protein
MLVDPLGHFDRVRERWLRSTSSDSGKKVTVASGSLVMSPEVPSVKAVTALGPPSY